MCMIHLRHPNHGVKVAYLEAEAVADERAGWVRFDPKSAGLAEPKAQEAEQADKPRRGRKPKAE